MKNIFVSLLITSLVSALVGLLTPIFFVGFALAFILQILIFYIGNTIYNNYIITKIEQIKLKQLEESRKQEVVVSCPCSVGNKQALNLKFDEDIIYKCDKCEKNLKAFVDVKSFVTTQPIYFHDRTPKDND